MRGRACQPPHFARKSSKSEMILSWASSWIPRVVDARHLGMREVPRRTPTPVPEFCRFWQDSGDDTTFGTSTGNLQRCQSEVAGSTGNFCLVKFSVRASFTRSWDLETSVGRSRRDLHRCEDVNFKLGVISAEVNPVSSSRGVTKMSSDVWFSCPLEKFQRRKFSRGGLHEKFSLPKLSR